jgi:hypothetical protein
MVDEQREKIRSKLYMGSGDPFLIGTIDSCKMLVGKAVILGHKVHMIANVSY